MLASCRPEYRKKREQSGVQIAPVAILFALTAAADNLHQDQHLDP
jgi:hypothetical protein